MTTEVSWASEQLQRVLAPPQVGSVKARIRLAASRLKWNFSRARDIWYADPRVAIRPNEIRDITTITGVEYGREQVHTVESLIAQADALTMGSDPDFVRAFAAALVAFSRALAGPGNRG